MKKNQERRLHRKNAKIVKEGGTPLQLNRPIKPDTTVSSIRWRPPHPRVHLRLGFSSVAAGIAARWDT